jgi:hypothetical protein
MSEISVNVCEGSDIRDCQYPQAGSDQINLGSSYLLDLFPYIRVVKRLLKPDFSLRSMSILPKGAEKTAGMWWVGLEKF